MIPLLSQFLKRELQYFLRTLSLGGIRLETLSLWRNRFRSLPPAFDSVHTSIHVIVREADMESQQDNVEQIPTQAEVISSEEQTQQPQEQMPLRRSTRERRNVIPYDYIVFLQELEDIDGLAQGDPINFHKVM